MIGLNSGLIGVRRLPTTGSASGIWTPNEQSLAKRDINWPNVLNTISYVGVSGIATPTGSANAPAHLPGDILFIFSACGVTGGGLEFPTQSGYTVLVNNLPIYSTSGLAIKLQYKIATGTSASFSAWGATNYGAHQACFVVYRNATVGPNATSTNPSSYPSITFTGPSMTSWALLAAGGGNGDNGGSTPSGYTRRVDLYGGRLYDSATPVNALGTLPQPGANTYTNVPSFAAELKATG